MTVLTSLRPDLTVINLGIHDVSAGIPVATCKADMQIVIITALEGGDVIIVAPNQIAPNHVSATSEAAYLITQQANDGPLRFVLCLQADW
jgi:hypothetical protein